MDLQGFGGAREETEKLVCLEFCAEEAGRKTAVCLIGENNGDEIFNWFGL